MHAIYRPNTFKKDLKRLTKNPQFNRETFVTVVNAIARGETLAPKYRNHKLTGKFSDCFECHVQPDVLLIYIIDHAACELRLVRIGSHAELFG